MRKTLWMLTLALMLALSGCGGESAAPVPEAQTEPEALTETAETTQTESAAETAEPAAEIEAAPLPYEGNETGNADLDSQVYALLEELYDPAATEAENLRTVYDWVCQEITYRAGTADVSGGFTEALTQELAADGLAKRKGNCDTEAAVMAVLLRRLGYDCEILQGQFQREDGQWVDHAWVLAQVDGEALHFDPLYGRYYAEDPADYFMQPDSALAETHQWDAAAAAE